MPPEDWHEPSEEPAAGYRFIVQPPGKGYRHVLTPAEIFNRLSQLPQWMTRPLEIVQLSRMTRKKVSFPCYGMQWGSTLYLYPLEYDSREGFVEWLSVPPTPAQQIEVKMYGGRWVEAAPHGWKLAWSEKALRRFFLDNILIHELGHLLDNRNESYVDRERFAEWFAVHYGHKRSRQRRTSGKRPQRVKRRHHSV